MSGWSLKRIQHEAHKRAWANFYDESAYHPLRDGEKQQDWEWAVDRLFRRMEITAPQRNAAHAFYNAQQTLMGDIAPDPRGMRLTDSETSLERAERIFYGAQAYVLRHPDLTPMRHATFECLFRVSQPTLETVRAARVGKAKGRTKQGEAIDRIKWCVQVLADHFDGLSYDTEAAVNEKQMGVGEGWVKLDHVSAFPANYIETMQGRGYQIFMAPSGNVYARDPKVPSVFEPLDSPPQIAASKT